MVPMMPREYFGEITTSCGYTKTNPRKWTKEEIEWVKKLNEDGYSNKEIAQSIDRTLVSTQIKIKRLAKKESTYNEEHAEDKYQTNMKFFEYLKPKTVLDLYAGDKSIYDGKCKVTSNDKNEKCNTDYHLDALDCLCYMKCSGKAFDMIDLDPFGSAYDCFDLAIKLAKKGIAITFGEMGHLRFKRLDYVKTHYGIDNLNDFTLDNLIKEVQLIGLRNKKLLTVYEKKEWRNIGRVWMTIEPYKITSQWERKGEKNGST